VLKPQQEGCVGEMSLRQQIRFLFRQGIQREALPAGKNINYSEVEELIEGFFLQLR
jgi:hypothetical protein